MGRVEEAFDARASLWAGDAFTIDDDVGGFGSQQHATFQLKKTVTIEIDISNVNVGDAFTLLVEATAETMNRRQRKSYVAAVFRDPVGIEGTTVETIGLEPVAVPFDEPPDDRPVAPECNSGTDREVGTLQFALPAFRTPEAPLGGSAVIVTCTDGSNGAVSATIRSSDGPATARHRLPGDRCQRVLRRR